MQIKHYTINTPKIAPPSDNGWQQAWHGYYRMVKCKSETASKRFHKAEELAHRMGCLGEREFEVDCFLSILQDIQNNSVTFIELGAGYAEWCMALAGVINNKIVPVLPNTFKCYAIEAEPTHKVWAADIFETYKIPGQTIWGAISDHNGQCSFSIDKNPSDCYGQSITLGNSIRRSLGNLITREMVNVPCFTLDELLAQKGIEHIDLAHMDVQGAEARVIQSGIKSIAKGKIDYWLIGTHGEQYNKRIEKLLAPYYDLVVDMYPRKMGKAFGLQVQCQDGIQVYKKKSL